MFRITAALGIILTLVQPCLAQSSELAKVMKDNGIPSVSFAFIKNGNIARTEAFGEQSPGVAATPSTLYNIASLSKPLSAEIILRLASKGTLTLDEPMSPTFVDPDIAQDQRNKLLTPRLALSHQTGFPNWRGKEGLNFQFDPGTAYGYSGEGYQYVARFAEKKAGVSFEELADNLLFKPYGMTSTSYTGRPWFTGRIAVPVTDGVNLKPQIAQKFVAADLVYTTAGDYARFMLAVLNNVNIDKSLAKDRVTIQRSLKGKDCQGATAASCPEDVGPGLGWQVVKFAGHTILTHSGKDPGLFTFAYLDKTTGEGAVIFTNGDGGDKCVLPLLTEAGASSVFLAYLRDRMA